MRSAPATTEDRPLFLRLREPTAWRALRKPFRLGLLEAASGADGVTAQALAARVGITPQLMLYHLQLLEKAGLLRHEGGKRARGKGGRFRRTHARFGIAFDPQDAREMRRLDAVLEGLEADARARRRADAPGGLGVRFECLTSAEAREIGRCMARVEAVLAKAADRRRRSGGMPDATHAVSVSLRPVGAGAMPTGDLAFRLAARRRR